MGTLYRRRAGLLAIALVILFAPAPGRPAASAAASRDLPQLLIPIRSVGEPPPAGLEVVHRQAIAVATRLLPAGPGEAHVAIALPGGTYAATVAIAGPMAATDAAWHGSFDGVEASEITIAVRAGAVAGSLRLGDALYRITPGSGGSWLEEVDPAALPADGEGLAADTAADEAEADTVTAGDGGAIIDVMVAYTTAARTGAGGVNGISALAAVAIQETNAAYQRSLISQRVRLVYSGEVDYLESGNSTTDVSRMRDPSDGYMDGLAALRDQYGADLVVLITETLDECGRAYSMTNARSSFASSAFSVVKRTCATGQHSFAHEIGHNMGAGHDRATGCSGAYTYACGYQDPDNRFRTIMAYDCPVSCTRVPYFSNPDVTYLGRPTGIADGLPAAANNAKALNGTAAVVAAFKPSVNGVALGFGATPQVAVPGIGFTVTVDVQNSAGNTVVADQSTVVTLAVASGPGAIACDGSLSRTAVDGVVTFTNCRVASTGLFQLRATTADLPMTPATSAAIAVGGYRAPLPMLAADPGVG